MTARALPTEITTGLHEIERATDDLIEASRNEDADAMEDALERRSDAIERLEPHVVRFRRTAGPEGEDLLRTARAALENGADRARAAIEQFALETRSVISGLGQQRTAVTSYTDSPTENSTLDRSG